MSIQVLATKLYVPPLPPGAVRRQRLVDRLNDGLQRRLILVSAPAGFGKTALLSEWLAASGLQVAWLSLDQGDNDPRRFLVHLVAALRTVAATVGETTFQALQSPQPPPAESLLTGLLNDITTIPHDIVIVLDDYHAIDAKPVDAALTFVLEHQPPNLRVVIATREDPQLPLARLRAGGQLTELRAADLRFSQSEVVGFLNDSMALNLSAEDISTLETRTEGWIAGLQLAALSLQGHPDARSFIQTFSGSHRFVLDYLLEEVLRRQSEGVQTFLLRTSILERMCGPLCDAMLANAAGSGQRILEYLDHTNLFLVSLDGERRWYRYHHLFADLLRQRNSSSGDDGTEHHRRASQWFEEHDFEVEAFQHAAAAHDVERAERLIDGHGVPLQFKGAGAPVLKWLQSLPPAVLDARPSLWVTYATALFFSGRHSAVEVKLQAAETALQRPEAGRASPDLVGRIASIRATLAIIQRDAATILTQSRRALKYLDPDNVPIRTATTYTLGYAHQLQGDRAAAVRAYTHVTAAGSSYGESIYSVAATLGLGQVHEADNQLSMAKASYERVLHVVGDPPRGLAAEAHLGLARIAYERNDLNAAQHHGEQCVVLTRQMDSVDTFVSYAVFSSRLRLAQADAPGAIEILDEAGAFLRQHGFHVRLPDLAAARVMTLLRTGDLAAARVLADADKLPMSQARIQLAMGDTRAALAEVTPWLRQMEARGWADATLAAMVVQALVLHAHGDLDQAAQVLRHALALAEPGGFVRTFVDEGSAMADLLRASGATSGLSDYVVRLLEALEPGPLTSRHTSDRPSAPPRLDPLVEQLSARELEVLRLISQGLSNQEIGDRLFLALDTVKGHNRKIFGKLQVQRRTEAVARARELGLS